MRVENQIKKVKNNIWKIFEFQLLPILVILEVAELCLDLSNLIREVKKFCNEKEALHQIGSLRNRLRIQHSFVSDPSSAKYNKIRKNMEPMSHKYKKAFRISNALYYSFIFHFNYLII